MNSTDPDNRSNDRHPTTTAESSEESVMVPNNHTTEIPQLTDIEPGRISESEPHVELSTNTSDEALVAPALILNHELCEAKPSPRISKNKGTTRQSKKPPGSIPLRRSLYTVPMVLLYGGAAIYAWVIICILKDRPIGGRDYGIETYDKLMNYLPDQYPVIYTTIYGELDGLFMKNEKYLKSARIIQAIVSVLTIPLTSAVCSQAVVVYLQKRQGESLPTLRQSMALADKGWADIGLYFKLFFGGWNKYRSSLLLFALFLNFLGK